jgi:hypothetical protein
MNIEDVYHAVPDSRGGVTLRLRKAIQTTDSRKFYTGTGDPRPPQVRVTKSPASHPMIYTPPHRRTADTVRTARDNVRTRDTVLSCPTPEEMAEWSKRMATMAGFDGGLQWQGDLQPVGDAVRRVKDALNRVTDKRRVKDAINQAMCDIANYGSFLETSEAEEGPAGTLSFGGEDEMTLSEVHEANNITPSKASVGDSGGAQMRAWRDHTGDAIAKMQRANDAVWAKKPVSHATPAKLLESTTLAPRAKSWWKG